MKSTLNGLFKREADFRWNDAEEHFLFEICKRPNCLREMEDVVLFFKKGSYLPHKLNRLIGDWQGNVDRSRSFDENNRRNNPCSPAASKTITEKELEKALREIGK